MINSLLVPVALFIALIGGVFIGISVLIIVRSRRTSSWPQVLGTVIASEVQRKESGDPRQIKVTYHPYVRYEYVANGVSFVNDDYSASLIQASREPSQAAAILEHYPIGKKIPVFYNPSNPNSSVLITGDTTGNWVIFCVGLVLFLGGTVIALWRGHF